jgi:threonine synthase
MDIQLSSNFERLVYLANGRNPAAVRAAMGSLAQSQSFTIKSSALKAIRAEFISGATSEAETAATMARVWKETGELIDPHTAVGLHVAQLAKVKAPMVTLATAHPAKFPDAVKAATGQTPRLPQRLEHLMTAQESFTILPNSAQAAKDFILSRERR